MSFDIAPGFLYYIVLYCIPIYSSDNPSETNESSHCDVKTVAAVLKSYLRQLPIPLIPTTLVRDFLYCLSGRFDSS